MKKESRHTEPTFHDIWVVSQAAGNLTNQACTISARHIQDGIVRLQFNREVAYYARSIVRDVEEGRKTVDQGLIEIKEEQRSLMSQSMEVARKGVGLIAGALQFKTGAEICAASLGTLCVVAGLPMIAHGSNNVYENGRNLWEGRSDTEGPVRKLYQSAAVKLGGTKEEGDIAYGLVDIATSIYSAGRMVLKPDSWRLFRYVDADYMRAFKKTSTGGFVFDRSNDVLSAEDVFKRWGRNE
ncbi:DUF4225 domain-containing protein [uncultured Pseudomonas sp.]|uniref:DUF4225 domain-containing protein n=1 Tax=uncultured Pseudomonas sp. TaxID=114707 RepID=UPI002804F46E|nr:DUF4225 domain-containing protein [uncultured Pseudomonas sp.]